MKKLLMIMLAIISYGINAQNSPGVYTVKNAKINTDNSDFGTAFFGDDKVVFAAPKQGLTFNREEYHNQPFLDLYIGEVTEDGQIIKKQKLPGDINTKYHEGMVAFTKDMKTVYFSANNYVKKKKGKKKSTSYIQLFVANITEEGEWTNMKMVPFNSDKFSTGHPVLNRDDSKLYFVSDRPESIGKTDIFVVDVYEDGSFSEPRNLGPKINTPERDMFPFIGKDNVLYFSSDGYRGHGELDVYASKIFDSTVSTPINLEEPVNSEHDDFAYIIDDHKHRGYFSSNREGGHGDDDIYSFVASPPIYIECKQAIAGVVKDIDTQELIPDVLIILYDAKGIELQSFISSKDEGSFSFQQSCNTTYTIKGFLEGYLIGEMDIKTVNDLDAAPIEIILNLISDPNKQEEVIAEANSSEKEDKSMLGSNEDESTGLSSSSELERVDEKADQKSKGETTVTENTSKTEIASAAAVVSTKNESETVDAEVAVNTSKKKTVTAATPAAVVTTKTESETVDAEVVINAEDKQQEMTSATLEEQETQAQKAIAMDTSEAGQTLEDETGDSETKKSSESPIHINTIYFDFDKYDIRFDARIELDKIAEVLKQNPKTKIKVDAHTDIRGKRAYNLKLSDSRAYKTVQYLLDMGIEVERISGKGHGETQVVEKCTKQEPCTGLQHQLNRRAEFLIVDKFSDAIIAQSFNKAASGNYALNDKVTNSGAYVNYDFSNNRAVYTVQLGAFKGEVQNNKFSKLTDLFNYRYDDGLNRYYAGIFESSLEARNYMRKMRKNGFGDAFVVGLKGESRF